MIFEHPWEEVEHKAKQAFAQEGDVANNRDIRPDVYQVVKAMVPSHAIIPRSDEAPKVFDHPWDAVEDRMKTFEENFGDAAA